MARLGRPSQPSCRSACRALTTASGATATSTPAAATPHLRHGTPSSRNVTAWAHSTSTANSCTQHATASTTPYPTHRPRRRR
ncbi:hypothetical protein ACPCIU_11170 [Streptomyces seoulensis]|uniref:hypothetical protein n=1 Tax=Streptomyces seoulensis TaxID=73044 RepID=UPI003C2D831F